MLELKSYREGSTYFCVPNAALAYGKKLLCTVSREVSDCTNTFNDEKDDDALSSQVLSVHRAVH